MPGTRRALCYSELQLLFLSAPMRAFIWSSLLSGIRSHSFQLLLALSLVIIGLSWLAANFSARHPQTLALDVGLSGMRAILIFMALFWVQDLVARDIERKTVMFALSYPVPRSYYLLGRFFGIALLSAGSVAIMGTLLWCTLLINPADYSQVTPIDTGLAYWATCLYLYLSILVVTAFALLIATLSTTPMLPLLLGIGFAVVASSIGATLDFLLYSELAEEAQREHLSGLLQAASWAIPDLSRLDIRDWTLYGARPDAQQLLYPLVMAFAYISIMLGLAVNRFQAREFN
jgi:ABC-type transport system involved in multi-copper enzyme maturation permease subunit